ncbi:MAG: B3/4 domain-containing protein [Oscillospiraceae bacterium]|nr:B3/4 domain-containing protein [Oscillospiraceae bacterium]
MKISIQKEISEKYPQYKMGLVKVSTASTDWEKLQSTTKYEKSIADHTVVKKDWLEVFSDMNASERRLPSVVALWSIIDRFDELKPINYFVDSYNYISIKHGIPMGGYDVQKLPYDELSLQHAVQGGMKFQPMGLARTIREVKRSQRNMLLLRGCSCMSLLEPQR